MRRLALLLCACGAALVLAGCGGGGQSQLETVQSTGAGGVQPVIVHASKGSFSPEGIYAKAAPGVVTIISLFGPNPAGTSGGQGSGFVISDSGEILTNAHVVTSGGKVEGGPVRDAKQVYVQFADGSRVPADIVGTDPDADVALIKVNPDGLDLSPLTLSDGKDIAVGAPVAAIGSPFGKLRSMTVGIISATDRTIESLTDFPIDGAIQTDAAINPGNSGGPLLDADVQVIGINQQIASQAGEDSGVSFAVPVDAVRYSLAQLRENGEVNYPYIGVTTYTLYPQIAARLGIDAKSGALIERVLPNSPAEDAGLHGGNKPLTFQADRLVIGGDAIVAIDGVALGPNQDLGQVIGRHRPGDKVTLDVVRDGNHREVTVTLGTRPSHVSG